MMHGSLSFGHWLKQRRKALDLTQHELARLAEAVVTRERRYARPVETVRIETWRIDYARDTLAATSRLLREYVYRVDTTAAPRR